MRSTHSSKGAWLVHSLALVGLLVGPASFAWFAACASGADDSPIPVRHVGGSLTGFLVLKDERGELLANGEATQSVLASGELKSSLTFHFRDGSLQQETTVFSQRKYFRLRSHHLVQKGPAFKQPIDMVLNGETGDVTVRYAESDGAEKVLTEHTNLPPNLANGLVPTMIENMAPQQSEMAVELVVATPKPRLVSLRIRSEEESTFSVGHTTCKVRHFVGKIEIGGVVGAVAGIVGKQPPDSQFWIVQGVAPTFVKSEAQQFAGGPLWEVDLVAPSGPKENSQISEKR